MKKLTILALPVILVFLLTAVSCAEESTKPIDKQNQSFSFAVITDLHIGYGIPNYYPEYQTKEGFDWLDGLQGKPGQDDNHAVILEQVVERIINEKNRFNIKFVAVLGDISDTAEKSEFLRAREILNRLNEAGVPYIPLMGNHDTWPYTQPIEDLDPNDRTKHETIAEYAAGDKFFEDIFWREDNQRNIRLIQNIFGNSWQKAKNPIDNLPGVNQFAYLQNYGFVYQGITFLALDLAPRVKNDSNINNGVAYPGANIPKIDFPNPQGFLPTNHMPTLEFARNYTKNHNSSRQTAILLSHYRIPLISDILDSFVSGVPDQYNAVYNFYGHIHNTADDQKTIYFAYPKTAKTYNVLTEDIGNIDLLLTTNRTNKPIRIVQIKKDAIDYSMLLPKRITAAPTVVPTAARAAVPTKISVFPQTPLPAARTTATTTATPVSSPTATKAAPTPTLPFIPLGKIAFVSNENGNQEIYLLKSGDAKPVNLTNNPAGDEDPDFSPDGQRIVFVSNRTGNPEIYIMDANGSRLKQLTNSGKDTSNTNPTWFPDGSKIIFSHDADTDFIRNQFNYSPERLFVMDADGKNQRKISVDLAKVTERKSQLGKYDYSNAAVSPDGSKIVFEVSSRAGHPPEIYIINSDGTGIKLLLGQYSPKCPSKEGYDIWKCDFYYYENPSWSVNGKKVMANTDSQYAYRGIYLINGDGTGLEQFFAGKAKYPRFSPDGNWIIFSELESRISVLNVETKEKKTVIAIQDKVKKWEPVWTR